MADQFKYDEILTVENLKEKIETAPMTPRPVVKFLWYIYGWKNYVENKLSDTRLENHSKFNTFRLTNENGDIKLRAKLLPQDSLLVPRAGIKLLKTEAEFDFPVPVADVRVEEINFDRIMRGISIYLIGKSEKIKNEIEDSWNRLRSKLQSLPKKLENLSRMRLTDLPQYKEVVVDIPEPLGNVCDMPQLRGELYREDVNEGDIESEIQCGLDVCIYTKDKKSRPWVGRIVKVCEDREFIIQWFTRKSGRGQIFSAMFKADGSPLQEKLSYDTVMFWLISEPQSRTENSFSLSPQWIETIMKEYIEIDSH